MFYLNGVKMPVDDCLGLEGMPINQVQPKCPVCAVPMDLIMETGKEGVTASYACRACRNWMTQPVRRRSMLACSLAYQRATNQKAFSVREACPSGLVSLQDVLGRITGSLQSAVENACSVPGEAGKAKAGSYPNPDAGTAADEPEINIPKTPEEWKAYYKEADEPEMDIPKTPEEWDAYCRKAIVDLDAEELP